MSDRVPKRDYEEAVAAWHRRGDELKRLKKDYGHVRKELALADKQLDRIHKFLNAHAKPAHDREAAMTFVDPDTGNLVSANEEARALARACLLGPGAAYD